MEGAKEVRTLHKAPRTSRVDQNVELLALPIGT